MIKSIFLILFPLYLISATLTLTIAKDRQERFSVLHLDDTTPFVCKESLNNEFKSELVCILTKPVSKRKAPIENLFFKIYFEDNKVTVLPKKSYRYYSYDDSFIQESEIVTSNKKPSKHWMIIGVEKNSTLFEKSSDEALNLPLTLPKADPPYIGELDSQLLPVSKADGAKFIKKIAHIYKKGDYKILIEKVEQNLNDLESIFKSDASLYKLRAISKLIFDESDSTYDPMDLSEDALDWLDSYPSNSHIPEVLSMIVKSYTKMGRKKESNRFLQSLKSQFPNSYYYFDALIYQGDRYYLTKKFQKALKSYKDALYNTKNLKVAALSAMKLSNLYLDIKEAEKAKSFIKKIIKLDANLLNVDPHLSYEVAKKFSDNNESNISLSIADSIDDLSHIDEEEFLKNVAYWSQMSKNPNRAIKLYREYLKRFADGKYVDFVEKRLNSLILFSSEANLSKRMQQIDKIISKYKNDPLSHKAVIEKAKILLDMKEYKKILDLKSELEDAGGAKLLKEVAKRVYIRDLNQSRCKDAIKLKDEYNLTTPLNLMPKLFVCFKRAKKYKSAIALANKFIKQNSDPSQKAKYLYELAKLYKKRANYKAMLLAANDLYALGKITDISKYSDLCLDNIEAYYQIKGLDNLLLNEVSRCEQKLKDDVRLLDAYNLALKISKRKDDAKMSSFYAKKMIKLQKMYHIHTYSPMVEITLAEALRDERKYQEALNVVLKLLYQKLSDTQKAQVLYLAGYLSEKLDKIKEAKEFYAKCGEIVEDSAWVQLCAQNLELLER